jgi:hypothetical protein
MKTKIKTVAIEELVASTILWFCENLAELGCPIDAEPDMWYRELSSDKQVEVASKLIDIIEIFESNYDGQPVKAKKNKKSKK